MDTRKTLLKLIAINSVFMFAIVVLLSYLWYPMDTGMYRFIQLKKMHAELVEYKKETGELPKDIESLFRYDPNGRLFFGSTRWDYYTDFNTINQTIRYEIKNGEPVLVDLGDDKKEGGIGGDIDFGYPYKCRFPFSDFMRTDAFGRACWTGLLFSLVFTGGLGLEWRRRKACSKDTSISVAALAALIVGAILFGLVETVMAFVIMLFDVFPHH
jgi:hypothetical protein